MFGFCLLYDLASVSCWPSVIILPRFHVAFSTLSFALHCVISLPRFHVRFFWDLDFFVLSCCCCFLLFLFPIHIVMTPRLERWKSRVSRGYEYCNCRCLIFFVRVLLFISVLFTVVQGYLENFAKANCDLLYRPGRVQFLRKRSRKESMTMQRMWSLEAHSPPLHQVTLGRHHSPLKAWETLLYTSTR